MALAHVQVRRHAELRKQKTGGFLSRTRNWAPTAPHSLNLELDFGNGEPPVRWTFFEGTLHYDALSDAPVYRVHDQDKSIIFEKLVDLIDTLLTEGFDLSLVSDPEFVWGHLLDLYLLSDPGEGPYTDILGDQLYAVEGKNAHEPVLVATLDLMIGVAIEDVGSRAWPEQIPFVGFLQLKEYEPLQSTEFNFYRGMLSRTPGAGGISTPVRYEAAQDKSTDLRMALDVALRQVADRGWYTGNASRYLGMIDASRYYIELDEPGVHARRIWGVRVGSRDR